ncbi:MAG: DUF2007 domain-containing protein [Deltaproteobacteria bacterium]|nr:DUF2007 domain-containing protein [Deltaproteobacteria bacterium]MBW2123526.1 DUF2007 domain-containing protein [Deltaproteobacteria bacterium]
MADKTDIEHWRMSKAGTVANKFEEDMVSQVLEKEGIPFLIRRYSDTAYDGLYIPQKGWASVMVPDEFVERARGIIETLEKDFGTEDPEPGGPKPGIKKQGAD